MADFNINNTSQDYSYDYDTTDSYFDSEQFSIHVPYVVTCVITSIGLFLTLVTIYSLYTMVRKDHVVPIYAINLLISDLIQLCCLIIWVIEIDDMMFAISIFIYFTSVMVSVGFMVCIALERYLVIACPLWYRERHTIKFSVVLCVRIWVLIPFSLLMILFLMSDYIYYITNIIAGTFLLLPLPLFIFFLCGTLRALSASRVPSDEKRRIVGILGLVLLIYTLLFLPAIIWFMADMISDHDGYLIFVFVQLSPLADKCLYFFMRKGAIDKFLASVCCCRMDSNDSSRMDSSDITSSTA